MNTLVQGYLAHQNDFQLNCCSKSEKSHVFGGKLKSGLTKGSSPFDGQICVPSTGSSPVDESCSEGEGCKETDHSDAILKFISQMLMEEEDLENKPCMLHDSLALQATEKSLYDVLNNSPVDHFAKTSSINSTGSSSDVNSFGDSADWSPYDIQSHISPSAVQFPSFQSFYYSKGSGSGSGSKPKETNAESPTNLKEKKNHYREDGDFTEEHRSSKQLANNVGECEPEPLEMYDKVLLCSYSEPLMPGRVEADQSHPRKKSPQNEQQAKGSNRGRPRGSKKQGIVKEIVDLRSLLMQCAQAVAIYDRRTVNDLLMRIRQHSSPQGDDTERLAHYFANALEHRLANSGTASYAVFSSSSRRISAAEILKAYKTFITACPFRKMSNLLANKTINKLAANATTVHIIDFGILYGYQWPCLIQALSERPGGPPRLRITGIDFPQPGFRPAERVADSGRRLAKYCERFRVPFEYNAIAQKWETIKLEDLKIERDEFLVVNSLYRLHNVSDETVMVNSPRDDVLSLINKINPDMFIHGVVNGTYNTPFFVTRFREALFQFSSLFDMFEATIPREDQDRVLFEEEVFGKDAMNIIACEGTERIDRPETYKQWQVRHLRAGFKQLPLDQEIVKYVSNKVKREYHKDFLVDEDGRWMLQGWKGRVIHAISFWQPAHN